MRQQSGQFVRAGSLVGRPAFALSALLLMSAPALAGEVLSLEDSAVPVALLANDDASSLGAIVSGGGLEALGRDEPVFVEPASGDRSALDWLRDNLERADLLGPTDYSTDRFLSHARAIPWDIAAVAGITTYFGLVNWEWGSSGFTASSEGWFGADTQYGGVDKLGHAYTGYMLTEYFSQRIAHSADDPRGAIITGAILGMGTQTLVEVFDGFSGGYGFSYEDLIADGVGVGFSMLRNMVPGMADKVDFRLEYLKSDYSGFEPVTDYAGQKYVLALKLSGFEAFEDTPLRFVELQAGYFARGFTDGEREAGVEKRREPFVAIGLNLNELLGEAPKLRDTTAGLAASRAFEYLQVPYTYVPTVRD